MEQVGGIHTHQKRSNKFGIQTKRKICNSLEVWVLGDFREHNKSFDFAMYLCRAHHASCGAILDPRAMDL